jgi:hypothetical protein
MAQAISCRPVIAEVRVQQVSPRDISWWSKSHWHRLFSKHFGFPKSLLFHESFILIFVYTLL